MFSPKFLSLFCLFVLAAAVFAQSSNDTLSDDSQSNNNRRMIDGKIVSGDEWKLFRPWQVQNVCDFGKGWVPCGCSSTIINEHYLITAGHCLACPYAYKVGLRFSDGSIDDQPWQEIHTPHWKYGDASGKLLCGIRSEIRDDIGLQYLAKPIHFRLGVQPFHGILNRRGDCQSGHVAGWGSTTEEGANFQNPVFSDKLVKLREKVYPNIDCQIKVNTWFQILDIATQKPNGCTFDYHDGLLCASAKDLATISFSLLPESFGVPTDPKGICLGDSGSPLVDILNLGVSGFVSDNLSTNPYVPCGYGVDVFTKFTNELKGWVEHQLKVTRPKHYTCPPKP